MAPLPARDLGPADLDVIEKLCDLAPGTLTGYVLFVEMTDDTTGILTNACCLAHALNSTADTAIQAAEDVVPCSEHC